MKGIKRKKKKGLIYATFRCLRVMRKISSDEINEKNIQSRYKHIQRVKLELTF